MRFLPPFWPPFWATFASAALLGLTWGVPAAAQLMEPDGLAIPRPVNNGDETGAEANPGSLSLEQLFLSRNETVDWLLDAVTEPATFEPRCSFTGTLVMRGGGCEIDFGWYNVNMSSDTPPPDAEIYTLVPGLPGAGQDPVFDDPFQPQAGAAGMGAIDANGNPMDLVVFTADAIRQDPNYLGGEIGFALKGGSGICPQTHFSEQRLNIECTAPGCMAGDHWIAAIIYQSQVTPNAYYIAFEDVAMSPDSFAGPGPFYNDGDFNDFIYFVEGITCDGGGVPCDTMLPGVCGPGLTECQPDGSIECRSQIEASPEQCDALDNDCNGMVDDGDLCDDNELCVRGKCEPFCNTAEFACREGYVCLERVCVEVACTMGMPATPIVCPEGEICQGGECVGVCEGVVCPVGQQCEVGVCVNPCAGVTCDEDEICQGGVCVLNCNCRPCSTGVCNTMTGECVDPACENVPCVAPEVCVAGTCVDPCANAVCPGGAMCTAGVCGEPIPVIQDQVDTAEIPDFGPIMEDAPPAAGGANGAAGNAGSAGVTIIDTSASFGEPPTPTQGCGCHLPGQSTSRNGAFALGALLLGAMLLRRRQ